MHYRRPRRRKQNSYLAPFIIIALIFVGAFYAWRGITNNWITQNQNTISEKVFLSIENGSAKAMTVGKKEWQNAPDKIDLYRGEKIKTSSDGRATLTYANDSLVRLNTNSEAHFLNLKRRGETFQIETRIESGEAWVTASKFTDNDSEFIISTDLFAVQTTGSTFAVETPGNIYVLSGKVDVDVLDGSSIIRSYNVGVGQQLSITPESVESLKRGEDTEALFAMSNNFRATNWYLWNNEKDQGNSGDNIALKENEPEDSANNNSESTLTESEEASTSTITTTEVAEEEEPEVSSLPLLTVTSPTTSATNQSSVRVAGTSNPDKVSKLTINDVEANITNKGNWSTAVDIDEDTINTIEILAFDAQGVELASENLSLRYDNEAPKTAVITSPKSESENEPVIIETEAQIIEGEVESDVAAIIVNDYRLTQFKLGDETFKYFANTQFNNLEEGLNTYTIYTEDEAGNQSEPTIFELELKLPDNNSNKIESPSDEPQAPEDTSQGGVKITSPNGGVSFETSETEHEIKGEVPENTTKVTVNDYELSQFKEGDSTFAYRAYASMKSLSIGEKNTYTVKAFDNNDKVIGSATITIDVQSGEGAAPTILIPSNESTYTTSLDTVVVAGKVGKWVTRVYLNGAEIKEYIPGSEEFKKTFKLEAGENKITIKAEKAGSPTGEDSIIIIYQP